MHRERQRGQKSCHCCKAKMKEDRALYESWTSGASPPIFQLKCPDFNLVNPIIDKLGPGGIITDDLATFDLDNTDSGSTVESACALAVHAIDFGQRFNKAGHRAARDDPLVFDTGDSSGLSPFKYDLFE